MSDLNDVLKNINLQVKKFNSINPEVLKLKNPQNSEYQFEILKNSIQNFEKTLDENSEVAIQLASFGQSVIMNVTQIGFSNPSLLHFYGYVNGTFAELIQHISQLNFLLSSVPKAEPTQAPRRIGFLTDRDGN